MATGVVTIGRRLYASGLYWENSPNGRISQTAKEAARQPGTSADFYATRSGNKQGRVPQFGLAPATEGFKPGIPSIAGCLANQQPGSWLGAFRMREGTALVIVRDDLIVPDGDQFFLDESEARDRLYQEMAIGGFQKIYAPEAWGVPGADTMPVTLLLNERTDVRLSNVMMSQQAKSALAIGSALLLLVIGVSWYIQDQKEKEEILHQQQLAALERMKAEAQKMLPGGQQQIKYPPPERKWEDHPQPLLLLSVCNETLANVKLGVTGWSIGALRCTKSGLEVKWGRTAGFADPPPNSSVAETTTTASATYPLVGISPRGQEDLWDPDVITKRALNQNWQASLKREPDDPPPPPPPGHKGEWKPPPPPWVKRSFTFSVPVLPWTVPSFLEGIPGVVVTSIAMTGNVVEPKATWKVDGVIYENRR